MLHWVCSALYVCSLPRYLVSSVVRPCWTHTAGLSRGLVLVVISDAASVIATYGSCAGCEPACLTADHTCCSRRRCTPTVSARLRLNSQCLLQGGRASASATSSGSWSTDPLLGPFNTSEELQGLAEKGLTAPLTRKSQPKQVWLSEDTWR